ncbi:MAG: reverse transcriptase family protein [Chitinophagaceae bacterium]|nr:MAG: reverse transcriptase family protein [Chitinophagaceae bacterium]
MQIWLSADRFAPPTILKRRGGSEVWVATKEVGTGRKWLFGVVHLKGCEDQEALRDIEKFVGRRDEVDAVAVLGDFNIDLLEDEAVWLQGGRNVTGCEESKGRMTEFCRRSRTCLIRWTGEGGTRPNLRRARKRDRTWIDHIAVGVEAEARAHCTRIIDDARYLASDHLAVELVLSASSAELHEFSGAKRIKDEEISERLEMIQEGAVRVVAECKENGGDIMEESQAMTEEILGRKLSEPRTHKDIRRNNWWFAGPLQKLWRSAAIAQRRWRLTRGKVKGEVEERRRTKWKEAKHLFLKSFAKERYERYGRMMEDICRSRKSDSKKMFREIRRLWDPAAREKAKGPTISAEDGSWHQGAQASALIVAELVKAITRDSEIWSRERQEDLRDLEAKEEREAQGSRRREVGEALIRDISEMELIVATERQRTSSAAGLSGWTPAALKTLVRVPEWREAWRGKLNEDVRLRKFPESWSKVALVAIPKTAPPSTSVKEWRGIALTELGYRTLASVLNNRLRQAMGNIGWKRKHQFGFEPGRGTAMAVTTLAEVWERRRCSGMRTWAVFVDIAKAYDSVAEETLREAMAAAGFRGETREAIAKLYYPTMVTPARVVGETEGTWTEANLGVRQGCTLAPALFSLVVDLISRELEQLPEIGIPGSAAKINQLWYADDGCLLAADADTLQRLLNCLGRWLERRGLRLNSKKCKVMVSDPGVEGDIVWEETTLERVEAFKYLGVVFSSFESTGATGGARSWRKKDGNLRNEAAQARMKATVKVIGMLSRGVLRNKRIDTATKRMAAKAIIEGTAFYGVELWAGVDGQIEALGKKLSGAARELLSLPRYGGSWLATVVEAGFCIPQLEGRVRQLTMLWKAETDRNLEGTVLQELVREERKGSARYRGPTWMSEAFAWMCKMNINLWICSSPKEVRDAVEWRLTQKLNVAALVVGSDIKKRGEVRSVNGDAQVTYLRRVGRVQALQIPADNPPRMGTILLRRLRTGAWWRSGRLWRAAGKTTSNHTCLFCAAGVEDEHHLLWSCPAWEPERRRWRASSEGTMPGLWQGESNVALEWRTTRVLTLFDKCGSKESREALTGAALDFLDRTGRKRAKMVTEWMEREASDAIKAKWVERRGAERERRKRLDREMWT